MAADPLALRRVPARFYGLFMSVNPVLAALAGVVILGQSLALADWLSIAAVVAASAVSIGTASRTPGDVGGAASGLRPPGRPGRQASLRAPGPGTGVTSRADSRACPARQRSCRRTGSPQSRCRSLTCGPAGPTAYLSPHSISATRTG